VLRGCGVQGWGAQTNVFQARPEGDEVDGLAPSENSDTHQIRHRHTLKNQNPQFIIQSITVQRNEPRQHNYSHLGGGDTGGPRMGVSVGPLSLCL
jgi:hypothetical protein